MSSFDLLAMGDLSAAVVGYMYADAMGSGTSASMQAVRSLVVSVIARIASKSSYTDFMGKLKTNQKNQMVVAILSALANYNRGSMLKAAISGVSIDLLANQVLLLFNQDPNSGFFNVGGAAAATGAPTPANSYRPPGLGGVTNSSSFS